MAKGHIHALSALKGKFNNLWLNMVLSKPLKFLSKLEKNLIDASPPAFVAELRLDSLLSSRLGAKREGWCGQEDSNLHGSPH